MHGRKPEKNLNAPVRMLVSTRGGRLQHDTRDSLPFLTFSAT